MALEATARFVPCDHPARTPIIEPDAFDLHSAECVYGRKDAHCGLTLNKIHIDADVPEPDYNVTQTGFAPPYHLCIFPARSYLHTQIHAIISKSKQNLNFQKAETRPPYLHPPKLSPRRNECNLLQRF